MGTYLVGYDILRSYMHSFLLGRRPLFTFYQALVSDHLDRGNNIEDILTYNKLRCAWNAFIKLLDLDFQQGFCCHHCNDDGNGAPSTVICDGTSLSFQRRMWKWEKETFSEKHHAPVLGFSERICIPDVRSRNLLKRYAAGGHKGQKVLSDNEKGELFLLLKKTHLHLHNFLNFANENHCNVSDFLSSLSSPSPVCAYIRPNKDVEHILIQILKGTDLRKELGQWQKLHQECPILFDLLKDQYILMTESASFINLMVELWNKACAPFVFAADLSSTGKDHVVDEQEMSFFPSLTKSGTEAAFQQTDKGKSQSVIRNIEGILLYCQAFSQCFALMEYVLDLN
ncbi:uncharacterized protein LOC117327131 [Pecten maximus]|uniref:uncharacterized protein LOC117327131 n=1 Tax=Pecten maximus TaxID=6579 RepID=UPI001458FF8A|nr:uncharacterized protein LOC117327131 [Pecten maximus]XP_033739870.1 uncharacterized protein LOC117327131 [Pecten maximus]